ncbi:baseplate J/gp47 family protein [Vibrio hannami]|uniref:baseplate J/gp47 family protein n=1 Tax=Vibrio hannami TaxID=2717094 RepID=UPI00241007C9|nr:baseplate J/gp47 family protein [Vibrio hannami]MDG3089128.1 baseplate J/gp47 family protein [Vibrio hannami]
MTTPEILQAEPVESIKKRFIEQAFIPQAIQDVGEVKANLMAEGLQSTNETACVLLNAVALFRNQETRNDNYKGLQFFAETVTESDMVDLICSRNEIVRQVIQEADPNANPPKPEILESDKSMLLRNSLAPFGLATTGTREGYRFHALTVGERPLISVTSESENVVVVRYEFRPTDGIERPKSAEPRMVEPNSGKVELKILSRTGNGQASPELIQLVRDYLTRTDIAQETDELSVSGGEIIEYEIDLALTEIPKPNQLIDREGLNKRLAEYAEEQHILGGKFSAMS